MVKFLSTILISVTLAISGLVSYNTFTDFHAQAEAKAVVHELMANDENGLCSAVTIAPDKAVTAAHCIELVARGAHLVVAGKNIPVTDGKLNPNGNDNMVITAPGLKCPCAIIADKPAKVGEKMIVVGYPYGLMKVLTLGFVQGFAKIWYPPVALIMEIPPKEVFLIGTAPVLPGNSGGGVFVQRGMHAELVGVTSRGGGTLILASVISKADTFISKVLVTLGIRG